MFSHRIVALCFLLLFVSPLAARADSYGAEANPTGDPVGGGTGYSRIYGPGDADVVVNTRTELLDALAAATSGTIIYVADAAQIDLTGYMSIGIPGGATLASGRGRAGSEGGLLYTNSPQDGYLFRVRGPGVRVTGLRIEGPYPGTERLEFRPTGVYSISPFTEIDNCEFFGWSTSAISFSTGATTGSLVHHNYIHHNQRDGLGYGVVLNAQHIFIQANLFDFCRHAIASTGQPGSGYDARWNVHLENTISHMFDMHGERDFDKYIIVGLWHLDEGTGTLTDDYSIYNGDHNGTLVNMTNANWTTGRIHAGVFFDGVDDYIDFASDANLSPTPQMTLAVWAKAESVEGTQTLFGKGDSGANGSGYSLRIHDGQLEAVLYDSAGVRRTGAGGALTAGAWHYLALTHNGSTVRLYVDGSQVTSFPCSGIAPSSYRLLLGRDALSATNHFRGILDEARLYSDDLTAAAIARQAQGDADIAGDVIRVDHNTFRATNYEALTVRGRPAVGCWAHHNRLYAYETGRTFLQINATGNWFVSDNLYRQNPPPPAYPGSGALAQWLFDEGAGSAAADSSGNGNHAALINLNPATAWVAGASGSAIAFSSSTDRVEAPFSGTLATADSIAFSFLIRFDAFGAYQDLFDNGFFRFYHRGEWAGRRLYFLARIAENTRSGDSAWNYWSGVRTDTELTTGTWHHIVGYRSGRRMAIAIDGVIERDLEVFTDGYTPNPSPLGATRIGDDLVGAIDSFEMFRIPDAAKPLCTASLNWTGQTDYETDGLDPETGPSTATFVFRIRLTDSTGREPAIGFPRLHILRDGEAYTNEAPVTMLAVDQASLAAGRDYVYSMRLPKSTNYSYFFETETEDGVTTRSPEIAGPAVPVGASAPLLSLANTTGYVIDGVEPDAGDIGTVFSFRIKYTDLDDDPPAAAMPRVHIFRSGSEIAGSPFALSALNAEAFHNGRIYALATTLTASNSYQYRFEAADATGLNAEPTLLYSGPAVAGGSDIIPPSITDIRVEAVTAGEARIVWNTDEPADSRVLAFPTDSPTDTINAYTASPTMVHSELLSSLRGGTSYRFRVESTDAAGNTALSGFYDFKTLSAVPAAVSGWELY